MNDLLTLHNMLDWGVLTKWERAFVVGCTRHRVAGRELTEKQVKTLAQIRAQAEAREAA